VPMGFTLDDLERLKVSHNPLIRNILKTVTDTRLDPGSTYMCYVGTTLFRLVPSDLALDDLEGSKSETLIMHWTAVEPGDRCDKLATFGSVTAIDMWGYIRQSGLLAYLLVC